MELWFIQIWDNDKFHYMAFKHRYLSFQLTCLRCYQFHSRHIEYHYFPLCWWPNVPDRSFFFSWNSHYLSPFPPWITKAACEPSEIEFLIDLQWVFFPPLPSTTCRRWQIANWIYEQALWALLCNYENALPLVLKKREREKSLFNLMHTYVSRLDDWVKSFVMFSGQRLCFRFAILVRAHSACWMNEWIFDTILGSFNGRVWLEADVSLTDLKQWWV